LSGTTRAGRYQKKTFTHSHPSWSSDILYHLPPFTMIHGILFVCEGGNCINNTDSGGVDQCGVNSLPLNLWQYMTDCCIATSDIARRWHLQSASCHQLFIQRHRHSTFGRRAFSVAGLAAWNSLPGYLRDLSGSFDSFHCNLELASHTWNKIILVNMQSFLPFSPTNGSDQVKTSMKFGSQ